MTGSREVFSLEETIGVEMVYAFRQSLFNAFKSVQLQ